jgi:hypothetical protein
LHISSLATPKTPVFGQAVRPQDIDSAGLVRVVAHALRGLAEQGLARFVIHLRQPQRRAQVGAAPERLPFEQRVVPALDLREFGERDLLRLVRADPRKDRNVGDGVLRADAGALIHDALIHY